MGASSNRPTPGGCKEGWGPWWTTLTIVVKVFTLCPTLMDVYMKAFLSALLVLDIVALVGGLTHPPGEAVLDGWVGRLPRVWVVVTVCPPPAHQPPGSLQSPLSGDTSLTNSVLRRFFLQGSHTTPTKCVANLNPIFTSNSSTKHQVQRIVWI